MGKRIFVVFSVVSVLLAGVVPEADGRPCGQETPCDPIVLEGPIPIPFPANDPQGVPNVLAGRPVDALSPALVEEEYFMAGEVDVYNFDAFPAERGARPGDRLVVYDTDLPYKTRLIVRRPAQRRLFSGDVVIEMLNSTAGFDSSPSWLPSAEYFAREGIVYIGVSTSGNQSIPFLRDGCGGLNPPCGARYADFVMTDNGQEYELISQLVTALKSPARSQRPLPMDFRRVKRVFLTGQSQQGGSVITYASEFHFPLVDGYFFMGASSARAIRGGFGSLGDPTSFTCGTDDALPYPDCVSRLTGDERRVRTDLPVPVYRGSSEGDVGDGSTRQKDTDTSPFASFRLIEVPATSHNPIHSLEILPGLGLDELCLNEAYSLADGPIFGSHVWNAMWENMRHQVRWGIPPPKAPRIRIRRGEIQRDQFGNARGGVRLPELNAPTNSYFSPNNTGRPTCGAPGSPPPPECVPAAFTFIGNLACRTLGSLEPLPQETIDALYPTDNIYVLRVIQGIFKLMSDRFLLVEDAILHLIDAVSVDLGR